MQSFTNQTLLKTYAGLRYGKITVGSFRKSLTAWIWSSVAFSSGKKTTFLKTRSKLFEKGCYNIATQVYKKTSYLNVKCPKKLTYLSLKLSLRSS